MAIISGVNIPDSERLEIGLTRLYGIGRAISKRIIDEIQIDPNMRVKKLTEEDITKIRSAIDRNRIPIEGDLRREVQMNIRRLMDIHTYRGNRHRRHLPVRGQRTKTNARQKRGRRQTVAGRRRTAQH